MGATLTEMHAKVPGVSSHPLSSEELRKIEAYWRACNYLAAGMIYLWDNPLLREPLKKEQIKNRLLGHWGSSPGLSFTYIHLNRLIKQRELDMIYIIGPGHGGPGPRRHPQQRGPGRCAERADRRRRRLSERPGAGTGPPGGGASRSPA